MKLADLRTWLDEIGGSPSSPGGSVTRRRLLRGAAVLSGALGVGNVNATMTPKTAVAWSRKRWLVRHITQGLNQEELARVDQLGYEGYLEYHLAYEAIDDSALEAMLAAYPTLFMTPYELHQLEVEPIVEEFLETTLLRSMFSKRQLVERAVEFWTDHFNVDIDDRRTPFNKPTEDRVVIRKHALGKFPDLLIADAHSPAMLLYLDNALSKVGAPNENYARELMELHTLGVDGGYTQADVEEVARAFTGWSMVPMESGSPDTGQFIFNPQDHDTGPKTVLGYELPAGRGIEDGLDVLDILVHHPSTAKFIARKLCTFFLKYNPPAKVVASVAATYTATGGDIKAMIRAIFRSPDVLGTPLKFKRPYQLVISALRATGALVTDTLGLQDRLIELGQLPFYWPTPDGYPDLLEHWSGLALPRWNFGAALIHGEIPGVTVDVAALVEYKHTAAAIMDMIDKKLFGGEMPAAQKSLIQQYLLPDPPSPSRVRDAVGLALDSPAFQWY